LIEGDTEESALPILADALGHSFVDSGVKLVNIKGDGRFKKMQEFLQYLKDSDTNVYVIADGNKEVRKKIGGWKTDLLKDNSVTIWSKEFEDCFSTELIVEAMKRLAKKQKFVFNLTSKKLEKQRKQGRLVVKILQEHLFENNQGRLDKPALGETIATILAKEIRKGKRDRLPSTVESIFENIFVKKA